MRAQREKGKDCECVYVRGRKEGRSKIAVIFPE